MLIYFISLYIGALVAFAILDPRNIYVLIVLIVASPLAIGPPIVAFNIIKGNDGLVAYCLRDGSDEPCFGIPTKYLGNNEYNDVGTRPTVISIEMERSAPSSPQ